jgi:hypothetical protein
MKKFLPLTISLTIAVAQFANAKPDDRDRVKQPSHKQRQAQPHQQRAVTQAPKFQRSPVVRQQTPAYRAPHVNRAITKQTPVYRAPHVNRAITKQTPRVRSFDQDAARNVRPYRSPNQNIVRTPRTTATVQSNVDRSRIDRHNRNRNNSNWQNRDSNNNNHYSWNEARRRHYRQHHDRNWWRSRYSRFALFGTGYYFWTNGYWYPAYGYDPGYNSYAYDEPIYGYNDMDPGQVIASVQTALQRLGYYRYAVDGQMGPATRAAIATYQRDSSLSITSAIDRPTLYSLGLN